MSTLTATMVVPLYAGFWRRAGAAFLDGLLLVIPNIAVMMAVGDGALSFVGQVVIAAAYYSVMHSSDLQATLGKRAFGIKVTDREGNRLSLPHAIGRYFATWISTVLLCIGFLMAAFTARKQALHDLICGTLVVNREAAPAEIVAGGGTMPVTGGVWAAIVILFGLPFFGGIAAAIAIPAYQDYTIRAKVADVLTAATPLKRQVEQAQAQKRSWPTGPVAIGSRFAAGAEISSRGDIVVTVVDAIAPGGRIVLVPTDAGGAVEWKCSAREVKPQHLPVNCRP